jgi:hypothetical protein
MKKYVTFVKDEEESRKVQESLFKAGFGWLIATNTVSWTSSKFLFIANGTITRRDTDFVYAVECALDSHTPLESSRIIADPFQLDGAKPPKKMHTIDGKEWSEDTLKLMIRQYVD